MKQSTRSTPSQGKGSKHRPTDFPKFWKNYAAIFKKKSPEVMKAEKR